MIQCGLLSAFVDLCETFCFDDIQEPGLCLARERERGWIKKGGVWGGFLGAVAGLPGLSVSAVSVD